MKRKQVFQFSNQKWYPSFLKRDMYEFMSWFVGKVNAAKPFLPVLEEVIGHTQTKTIINIDSKIGAGIETLLPLLPEGSEIINIELEKFSTHNKGIYTFINSFHQLDEKKAAYYLTQIANSGNSVAVLEGNNDSLWQVVGMTIFVPLTVILSAPFVQPFRITRLIFTYLIPILPVVTMLDGFLALFKLYNPNDLNELVSNILVKSYVWKSGKADNGRGGKIIYLVGYPGN
ncbi:MAG: hypothetical protein KA270_01800 [Saprospiraceae bacterium]|nr:hypothetical protein [Saprospiraceae bacterium]MBP6565867.1 hypothetical protein [Saprospiraceae bacterium]